MRDYINQEALTKTLQSYQEAMAKLFAISRHVVPGTNRTNDSLPTEWRMEWVPTLATDRVQYTSEIVAQVTDLVEYGRPKIGYRASFIRVTGYAYIPFDFYSVDAPVAEFLPYTDEDGNEHPGRPRQPETISAVTRRLILRLYEKQWSLDQYRHDKGEVLHFMDAAPADIQQRWLKDLSDADKQIQKYNEAVEKIKPI